VSNGVRQGGIFSPILFCIYLGGLISRLNDAQIGCFIGQAFVGILAHADDIASVASTPLAMHMMLKIRDSYANEFFIKFTAKRSKCLDYIS
jgi:hypothetical protein